METLKRVALYARFSSDNQRTESIDAQLRALKKYCQDNHYLIVQTYVDEAKTGMGYGIDKRTAFLQMIKDAEAKMFDAVIVHKLDRFSRDRYQSIFYKMKLKDAGVSLISVLENLNDSPESILLESLIQGINQYYVLNMAREVMKGLKENAYQCKSTGGNPPLGFKVNGELKWEIDEEKAPIIRMIFDLYDRGFSYGYIIGKLHDRGYKTQRGNDFKKGAII